VKTLLPPIGGVTECRPRDAGGSAAGRKWKFQDSSESSVRPERTSDRRAAVPEKILEHVGAEAEEPAEAHSEKPAGAESSDRPEHIPGRPEEISVTAGAESRNGGEAGNPRSAPAPGSRRVSP
jgi:hypothetical protein